MRCPKCGSRHTRWRSGVGFEHEQICCRCWHAFEPDNVNLSEIPDQPEEEELLDLQTEKKKINARIKELKQKRKQ